MKFKDTKGASSIQGKIEIVWWEKKPMDNPENVNKRVKLNLEIETKSPSFPHSKNC